MCLYREKNQSKFDVFFHHLFFYQFNSFDYFLFIFDYNFLIVKAQEYKKAVFFIVWFKVLPFP